MEINPEVFQREKDKAKAVYSSQSDLWCPYFSTKITLNSDGFHHLQFSSRRERTKSEQLLKFRLLPLALEVIRKSGTVQEYRKILTPIGKPKQDGSIPMKEVEYWAFIGIVGDNKIKIRTIVRKVGNGNLMFWSVMLHSKRKNGRQKLDSGGIEDDE